MIGELHREEQSNVPIFFLVTVSNSPVGSSPANSWNFLMADLSRDFTSSKSSVRLCPAVSIAEGPM